jgi:hypothetical protein
MGDSGVQWFVAPVAKVTAINDSAELMVGARGAMILGRGVFALGLGAYTLVSDLKVEVDGSPELLSFSYGGYEQDLIFLSDSLVHGSLRTLIGVGSASLGDKLEADRFFVAELSGEAELNLATWMRFSVGGGWRFCQGVSDLEGLFNEELSGFVLTFAVKLGSFQ